MRNNIYCLNNAKRDCFAYDDELDICTATLNTDCNGCNFYKHSNNPLETRVNIEMELAIRNSKSSKIEESVSY